MFFVYLYIFQNISCYCLSCFLALFSRTCQNFKTSHVIVYLRSCTHFLSNSDNFKTSHVIVYRYFPSSSRRSRRISKHLMLLFINTGNHTDWYVLRISKHLMLLFILTIFLTTISGTYISKHLMLLFIVYGAWKEWIKQTDFKTSHVIVYRRNAGL